MELAITSRPSVPEISEVRMSQRLLSSDSFVGIVSAHLIYQFNALLGGVGEEFLNAGALLLREIEVDGSVPTAKITRSEIQCINTIGRAAHAMRCLAGQCPLVLS